jgi:hypothetical protein
MGKGRAAPFSANCLSPNHLDNSIGPDAASNVRKWDLRPANEQPADTPYDWRAGRFLGKSALGADLNVHARIGESLLQRGNPFVDELLQFVRLLLQVDRQ